MGKSGAVQRITVRPPNNMTDNFGRTIDYLRLSITGRCNLRCVYCMPEEGVPKESHADQLSFEELLRLSAIFAALGIKKIKVTGGEPFVRKGAASFIARLSRVEGIESVSVTTNGVLLGDHLDELQKAGIISVNISLDSLKPATFADLSLRNEFARVHEAVLAAIRLRFRVKLNVVLIEGINDGEIDDFVRFARDNEVSVRFIELMPLGRAALHKGVPGSVVLEKAKRIIKDLRPLNAALGNGPAVYYTAPKMKGALGFINALGNCFCASCNRLRLDSGGLLKPCLSSTLSFDLKSLLRGGGDAAANALIKNRILDAVHAKPASHIFANTDNPALQKQDMYSIGG